MFPVKRLQQLFHGLVVRRDAVGAVRKCVRGDQPLILVVLVVPAYRLDAPVPHAVAENSRRLAVGTVPRASPGDLDGPEQRRLEGRVPVEVHVLSPAREHDPVVLFKGDAPDVGWVRSLVDGFNQFRKRLLALAHDHIVEVPERLLRPSRGVRAAGYKNRVRARALHLPEDLFRLHRGKAVQHDAVDRLAGQLEGRSRRQGCDAGAVLRFPAKINGMRHHRSLFIT